MTQSIHIRNHDIKKNDILDVQEDRYGCWMSKNQILTPSNKTMVIINPTMFILMANCWDMVVGCLFRHKPYPSSVSKRFTRCWAVHTNKPRLVPIISVSNDLTLRGSEQESVMMTMGGPPGWLDSFKEILNSRRWSESLKRILDQRPDPTNEGQTHSNIICFYASNTLH